SKSMFVKPVTAYNGVLSSWVTVDKKLALVLEASSAFSLETINSAFFLCSMLFVFNLMLLFLYRDKVNKDKIVINAILKMVVNLFKLLAAFCSSKSANCFFCYSVCLLISSCNLFSCDKRLRLRVNNESFNAMCFFKYSLASLWFPVCWILSLIIRLPSFRMSSIVRAWVFFISSLD